MSGERAGDVACDAMMCRMGRRVLSSSAVVSPAYRRVCLEHEEAGSGTTTATRWPVMMTRLRKSSIWLLYESTKNVSRRTRT